MKDNGKSPSRPMQLPRKGAGRDFSWKDSVSKKARPGPDLEDRSPQCYHSRLPNPLPTRKCEKQCAPRDTKQVFGRKSSLSIQAVYYPSLSTNYLFCYLFYDPRGRGRPKKNPSHFLIDTYREQASFKRTVKL